MDYDFITETGVKIIQAKDGYHFTSDAVALANFVRCRTIDTVIDVGCGGGVISLIINDSQKPKKIIAVDIQSQATALATQNINLNGFKNIDIFCADIREFHKAFGANLADVIVCNPPYFSTGRKSTRPARAASRHDETLTLTQLCTSATKLLKYAGYFYMCYPAKYLAKAIFTLESQNFRVREIKLIKNEKEIYLALIRAKKGGGDGTTITI